MNISIHIIWHKFDPRDEQCTQEVQYLTTMLHVNEHKYTRLLWCLDIFYQPVHWTAKPTYYVSSVHLPIVH